MDTYSHVTSIRDCRKSAELPPIAPEREYEVQGLRDRINTEKQNRDARLPEGWWLAFTFSAIIVLSGIFLIWTGMEQLGALISALADYGAGWL